VEPLADDDAELVVALDWPDALFWLAARACNSLRSTLCWLLPDTERLMAVSFGATPKA
jgi:hypothetical protein